MEGSTLKTKLDHYLFIKQIMLVMYAMLIVRKMEKSNYIG